MKAICAMDETGGIGKNGTLPWARNSEDLKWFKEMTTGSTVVMGRKTYEDPMMPHPLPNRLNVVLTSKRYDYDYCWDLTDTIFIKKPTSDTLHYFNDVFFIGGASLFKQAIENELIDIFYINKIAGDYNCDTFLDLESIRSNFECVSTDYPTAYDDGYEFYYGYEPVNEVIGTNIFVNKSLIYRDHV